ncbi:hypothetical protein C8Q76DRAFT_304105 [Earliella scabrosa]|nr:hypothetical protein C8Q76DRAFT_304105 [Earliella scabrosa]
MARYANRPHVILIIAVSTAHAGQEQCVRAHPSRTPPTLRSRHRQLTPYGLWADPCSHSRSTCACICRDLPCQLTGHGPRQRGSGKLQRGPNLVTHPAISADITRTCLPRGFDRRPRLLPISQTSLRRCWKAKKCTFSRGLSSPTPAIYASRALCAGVCGPGPGGDLCAFQKPELQHTCGASALSYYPSCPSALRAA